MALEQAIGDLVKRLEATTARLENVERQLAAGGGAKAAAPAAAAAAAGGGGGGALSEDSPFVEAFDELVSNHLSTFVADTTKLDELAGKQAQNFVDAVTASRRFVVVVASSKKPSDDVATKLLEPVQKALAAAQELRESKDGRKSKFWNHVSCVSEGSIQTLLWPLIAKKPVPHVKEYRGNSEFWSNKILMEFKNKDDATSKAHVAWVKSINGFLKDLEAYVKQYHTTGPAWNANGGDAAAQVGAAAAPAAPAKAAGGAPPGPPPPMPPPDFGNAAPKAAAPAKGPDTAGLFAELNKGAAITAGLKKVDRSQMTHKNPELRGSSMVPAEIKKKPATASPATAKKAAVKKPPVLQLAGNKWQVEWQDGAKDLVIDNCEPKHTVYCYKCENSVLHIKSKFNAITVDQCKKFSIVFGDVVSTVDVVNSSSIEMQCSGRSPSFIFDKTSGVSLYITSKAGLDTEIVTAKSDSMNVAIPGKNEGDDMIELPIPEQYKTVFVKDGTEIDTQVVRHE